MFLLVAMTFINTMECLNVFAVVERFLVEKGYSIKAMFWITGAPQPPARSNPDRKLLNNREGGTASR